MVTSGSIVLFGLYMQRNLIYIQQFWDRKPALAKYSGIP